MFVFGHYYKDIWKSCKGGWNFIKFELKTSHEKLWNMLIWFLIGGQNHPFLEFLNCFFLTFHSKGKIIMTWKLNSKQILTLKNLHFGSKYPSHRVICSSNHMAVRVIWDTSLGFFYQFWIQPERQSFCMWGIWNISSILRDASHRIWQIHICSEVVAFVLIVVGCLWSGVILVNYCQHIKLMYPESVHTIGVKTIL